MIKVVLADDHKIIRDGVKALIGHEKDIQVTGEAANGHELLSLLAQQEADIAIVDVNMPGMDGYEATKHIMQDHTRVKVIILSMLDHENHIIKMFEAGAMGYLLKNTGKEEFIHAIRMVASGQKYICTDIALNLLSKLNATPSKPQLQVAPVKTNSTDLSKREIEVLQLIAQGLTNTEIADKLFTSKRTIESHRQSLLEKTSSNNTATLIRYAVLNGLVE
jgi:DNA-binding NarL/FixJ family response regulator